MDSNKLYLVSDEYIDFLSKANSHVLSNKQNERTYHRKYLGLVTEFNGFKYFVPLSSPKEKDYLAGTKKVKKDSLTTIYMKTKDNFLGTIRFNLMIPVPELELTLYDLNDEGDFKYKMLVLNELFFIRRMHDKIEKTAGNLYKKKIAQLGGNGGSNPLLNLTLDFLQLEKLCDEWKSQDCLEARAANGSRDKFMKVLAKVPKE